VWVCWRELGELICLLVQEYKEVTKLPTRREISSLEKLKKIVGCLLDKAKNDLADI
jgi:hypothetical protein